MRSEDKYRHVIKEYSQRAAGYDLSGQGFLSLSWAQAVEMLNPQRGERILDAGCGTGEAMVVIAKSIGENGQVVGIDISEDMLNVARQKLSSCNNVVLIKGNLENISYADKYFDAIVNVNVMHYFYNFDLVLREFCRLLKPGGRLVLVGFCTDYLFFGFIEKMWRIFIPSHVYGYSLGELSQKVKEAGFEIVKGRRFKTGWFWRSMVVEGKKGQKKYYLKFFEPR